MFIKHGESSMTVFIYYLSHEGPLERPLRLIQPPTATLTYSWFPGGHLQFAYTCGTPLHSNWQLPGRVLNRCSLRFMS